MARLPTVGGDSGNWGTVLNDYLSKAHKADGTLRADVASIAALKALDVSAIPDKMQVLVGGYYAHADGGGGQFYYDASASDADNGGTIIAPTAGTGRWKRIYSGSALNVKWFGLYLDGRDETAALQALINSVTSVGGVSHSIVVTLYFPGSTSSIKLVPVSGNSAIFASSTRFVGEGCTIDLTGLTSGQIGIDLGNQSAVSVNRWKHGTVVSGFYFLGTGSAVWGIRCAKPYQFFENIYSKFLNSLFLFAQPGSGLVGPYMCDFVNMNSSSDNYGIYWPRDMDSSGSVMSYQKCDFAGCLISAIYIDHNITGSYALDGAWNFTDCTWDHCKQYLNTIAPTTLPWDRKLQLTFHGCWFEQFLRTGSTYGHNVGSGTCTFIGCKWVENGAWTTGSMINAGYNAYVILIGCQFDLVNAYLNAVATESANSVIVAFYSRSREGDRLALTATQYNQGERRAKMFMSIPASIPWGTVTATSALTELGTNQHGVCSLNNYNKVTVTAYISEAGPAGSFLGLQVKKAGTTWKWVDDVDGALTTGTGKIALSATGMISGTANINQNFFSSASTDLHEYRFVTYGGDGADSATLSSLSIALE